MMKKTLNYTIRTISIESLKRYYKPEEIISHCQHCPRYGLNWSCPPHDFNVLEYIARFKLAYIIGVKVPLSGFSKKAEAIGYYHECRHAVNQRLLQYELEISGSVVLIAGHCDLCANCFRQVSLECAYPDQRRYSLESLGFKVSEMMADIFDDRLQWATGQTPDHLYIVSGILSNSTCDVSELKI